MIPCCCPLFAIIQVIDVALLFILTISAGFGISSLSPSTTAAYASQVGSGIFAALALGLTVVAIGMRMFGRDVVRTITYGLGGCALGSGAFWFWLSVNREEDLICTGYSFMSSACGWSGMKYFLYAIFFLSVISQVLFFFIVKLGDIPCLNFSRKGKSRSMGKSSRRSGRNDADAEGEMRGLQGDWKSGSSEEESASDAGERKMRTTSGRAREGGSQSGNQKSAGLSDEEAMGGTEAGRRSSLSMGRY